MAKWYYGEVKEVHEGGGGDPGFGQGGNHPGNRPPGSWGGHPDQDLPGYGHPGNRPPGSGAHPGGGPIYHPGHPDHGLPPAPPIYHPGHPDHGLPGERPIHHPGHPDHGLPVKPVRPDQGPIDPARPDNSLPPGGKPIVINPPPPPPSGENANKIVVAIYIPQKGWTAKAYDNVKPDQGPAPGTGTGDQDLPDAPAPKK